MGKKLDNGRVALELVPPEHVKNVASVLQAVIDSGKYERNDWRKGDCPEWSRVMSSILRHLASFQEGDEMDPDTNLPHLWHASCQLMFLSYYVNHSLGEDDRHV